MKMRNLKKIKIIRKGFAQAMTGDELWINTQTDERVIISFKDKELKNELYCKHVKITIEQIDESEV